MHGDRGAVGRAMTCIDPDEPTPTQTGQDAGGAFMTTRTDIAIEP